MFVVCTFLFSFINLPYDNIISRYQKAIDIYEEIAKYSLKNNLLKYGVKGHLLNAGICQLCKGDIVAITKALDNYQVFPLLDSLSSYRILPCPQAGKIV